MTTPNEECVGFRRDCVGLVQALRDALDRLEVPLVDDEGILGNFGGQDDPCYMSNLDEIQMITRRLNSCLGALAIWREVRAGGSP